MDDDDQEVGTGTGLRRVRSRSFRRRVGLGSKKKGFGLGMTGIVPPSTKMWGVSRWKGGREVKVDHTDGDGEGDDDDDQEEVLQEQEDEPVTFGSNILVEEGTLLLTTSAAWEEAFHPTLGLMRRDRGGERVQGHVPDERVTTIGDDVEWLVLDLRFVMGKEEHRDEMDLLGIRGKTMAAARPGLGGMTHRTNSLLTTHAHVRSTSSESLSSASGGSPSNSEAGGNPAYLPKVHKLTFLGSECAETMSPSRAAEVKNVIRVLKGLLAVEW